MSTQRGYILLCTVRAAVRRFCVQLDLGFESQTINWPVEELRHMGGGALSAPLEQSVIVSLYDLVGDFFSRRRVCDVLESSDEAIGRLD